MGEQMIKWMHEFTWARRHRYSTHLLLTAYQVAAGGVALNKTNNIPALMGLNPSGGRQIISEVKK